jgi:hypothetical protein
MGVGLASCFTSFSSPQSVVLANSKNPGFRQIRFTDSGPGPWRPYATKVPEVEGRAEKQLNFNCQTTIVGEGSSGSEEPQGSCEILFQEERCEVRCRLASRCTWSIN